MKKVTKFSSGIDIDKIKKISELKNEPKWVLDYRLKSFEAFLKLDNPTWAKRLDDICYDQICYYLNVHNELDDNWDKVPTNIKNTFDEIGVIKAEKEYLGGIATQYESEMIYHNIKKDLEEKGVIFLDIETGIKKYPDIFKQYFGTLVSYDDNKFAALNSAAFSGGTFIYVPKNVKVEKPLHSYFRIEAEKLGQFERTLIIVDEGADLSYIEGCTAPTYSTDSLHAGVVEIFIKKGGRCRYTSIQNWSNNVYNLVTKRAICEDYAVMEWVDGNIGAKLNMKYPAVILKGDYSKATTISVAMSSSGQVQDTGSKMIHLGKYTSSNIISKSVSKSGGNSIYRGLIKHSKDALYAKTNVECDTLILDELSSSDTIPTNVIENGTTTLQHEAKVSKISEELLYYIMSRGISEEDANEMIIMGFIEPFTRELPLEYAVELNELLKLNMEGAVG